MTDKLHQHWRKSAEDWIHDINGKHMKANVDKSFPFLDSTASGLTHAHAAGLNGGASEWMEKLSTYCTYYCVSLTSFSTRKHRMSSNPSHSIQLMIGKFKTWPHQVTVENCWADQYQSTFSTLHKGIR